MVVKISGTFEHGKVAQTKQVKQFKDNYNEKITDAIYHRWNISTITTVRLTIFKNQERHQSPV